MSILGDLFGYDDGGDDLMGMNRDEKFNCLVCGRNTFLHTPEQNAVCSTAAFGDGKTQPTDREDASAPRGPS